MVDHQVECLCSLIAFLVHLFNVVRKAICSLLERRRRASTSRSDSSSPATRLVSKGCNLEEEEEEEEMAVVLVDQGKGNNGKKARKRPAAIVVPESCCGGFGESVRAEEEKDLEVEGRGYGLASRKGKMHEIMEDGYGVITDINGDSKQGASSGVCAATVLLNNRELHVGNVGDCRIVMSRKGEAITLTSDHTAGREDEKVRIENSGGYVSCRNGRWRVQDSLAVSRAIGDANLKEWIISEPETRNLQLTPDCEFLIMASDGLWDKVTDQEAVDVVSKDRDLTKTCKDLVEMSCRRGNRDDITVMVVDLQRFVQEN